MKRERQPSRRLRMHVVLLASDGLSPTEISRVLFCSRTTVYAVASRFVREGRAAFDDRARRGPKPLIGEKADERVEELLEEDSPLSMAGCARAGRKLIALQLTRERLAEASRETVRRALHRLGFRWRRPRPVPPEKGSEEQIEQKRARLEDVLSMVDEAGSFFQVETKLETNPKVGLCWMRKGKQKPLAPPHQPQGVDFRRAHFKTGVSTGSWGSANDELFIKLLDSSETSAATANCICG